MKSGSDGSLINSVGQKDHHYYFHPSEQLAKVEKQHELLMVDPNQPISSVENDSFQIDHVRVCNQESETDHLDRVTDFLSRESPNLDEACANDESIPSPQLR